MLASTNSQKPRLAQKVSTIDPDGKFCRHKKAATHVLRLLSVDSPELISAPGRLLTPQPRLHFRVDVVMNTTHVFQTTNHLAAVAKFVVIPAVQNGAVTFNNGGTAIENTGVA